MDSFGNKFCHTVLKRYSHFHDLFDKIREEFKGNIPQIPPRTFFSSWMKTENDFIEDRRKKLEVFMNKLLDKNKYLSPSLANFLNIDPIYTQNNNQNNNQKNNQNENNNEGMIEKVIFQEVIDLDIHENKKFISR